MKLYMIEYYDTELDMTDYTTVTANNEIDAMKYFIRATHGTKIVVECNRLGGVKEKLKVRLDHGRINNKTEKPDV